MKNTNRYAPVTDDVALAHLGSTLRCQEDLSVDQFARHMSAMFVIQPRRPSTKPSEANVRHLLLGPESGLLCHERITRNLPLDR
jgi:hypothetical protein